MSRSKAGKPSVYILEFAGLFYIGSATNPYRRVSAHKSRLLKGKNPSSRLQLEFDRAGSAWDNVGFRILCEFQSKSEALDFEQWMLDGVVGSDGCLNVATNARVAQLGSSHTPESRAKMSKAMKGRRLSDLHKERVREALSSDSVRQKMSQNNHKSMRVCVLGIEYASASEAQRATGIDRKEIALRAKSKLDRWSDYFIIEDRREEIV